jgi:hypothetical protein
MHRPWILSLSSLLPKYPFTLTTIVLLKAIELGIKSITARNDGEYESMLPKIMVEGNLRNPLKSSYAFGTGV